MMGRIPPPDFHSDTDTIRWMTVSNASGEDIPGGGLVRVTGSDADGVLIVDKPNVDSQSPLMIANPWGALTGDYGVASAEDMIPAVYDPADGTPAVGEMWGAKSGEWKLRKGFTGFVIAASPDEDRHVVEVVRGRWIAKEVVTDIQCVDGDLQVTKETVLVLGVEA